MRDSARPRRDRCACRKRGGSISVEDPGVDSHELWDNLIREDLDTGDVGIIKEHQL